MTLHRPHKNETPRTSGNVPRGYRDNIGTFTNPSNPAALRPSPSMIHRYFKGGRRGQA